MRHPDSFNEPDETFNIDLTAATNATIADNRGVATINDDDEPVVPSDPDCFCDQLVRPDAGNGSPSFSPNPVQATQFGDDSDDTLIGTDVNDLLNGFGGNDLLIGKAGNDNLFGGIGNDLINGNVGNDIINGNAGEDTVRGGQGNDILGGGQGDDLILGDRGADTISGDRGNDTLIGGAGSDLLVGDAGSDRLIGGSGNDIFFLTSGKGGDVIVDFQEGQDLLGLGSGLTFQQLEITQSNTSTLISVKSSGELLATLNGIQANLIGQNDFTLVLGVV